jgi:hypothetical protein
VKKNVIEILSHKSFKLCCVYHPERHFILYHKDEAVAIIKHEKEAIKLFNELILGLKNG